MGKREKRPRSKSAIVKEARQTKKRKLQEECNGSNLDPTPELSSTSSSKLGTARVNQETVKAAEGYRLLDLELLQDFIASNAACRVCKNGKLRVREDVDRIQGLACCLFWSCTNCMWQETLYGSKRMADRSFDVNVRTVHGCSTAGMGLTKIQDVFSSLNMPAPFASSSYKTILGKVCEASIVASEESMVAAANDVREKKSVMEDSVMCECTAMFDGTWQKRGHSSKHGVVSCISVDSSKVLDVAVRSSVCKQCERRRKLDKESDEYLNWYATHQRVCPQNHTGSAGNMEPQGVSEINEALTEKGQSVGDYKHRTPLPGAVLKEMLPVYNALTEDGLLGRCVDGYTQNACESFNSLVWKRCPKDRFNGRVPVDLAVSSAVCAFNDGRVSAKGILKRLGIEVGENYMNYLRRRDQQRVKKSISRASAIEKKKRESSRRAHKEREEVLQEQEGFPYLTGGAD